MLGLCSLLPPSSGKLIMDQVDVEGKRPLGRPRRRWEDNIKMELQEVGGGCWGLDGVGSG